MDGKAREVKIELVPIEEKRRKFASTTLKSNEVMESKPSLLRSSTKRSSVLV